MRKLLLKGVFRCKKTDSEATVWSKTQRLVTKFVDEAESHGWTVIAKPVVGKMQIVDESTLPGNRFVPTGGIWHPRQLYRQFLIPDAHPLAQQTEADQDLYIVWLPVGQRDDGKVMRVEVPDEIVTKMIAEDNPALRGVEVS